MITLKWLSIVAVTQLRREGELASLRSGFVSSVSHQLRTPVAQIRLELRHVEHRLEQRNGGGYGAVFELLNGQKTAWGAGHGGHGTSYRCPRA